MSDNVQIIFPLYDCPGQDNILVAQIKISKTPSPSEKDIHEIVHVSLLTRSILC